MLERENAKNIYLIKECSLISRLLRISPNITFSTEVLIILS